jgi:hypothetical protein
MNTFKLRITTTDIALCYIWDLNPAHQLCSRVGSYICFHCDQTGSGIHSASTFPDGLIHFQLAPTASVHGALLLQHLWYHHGMVLASVGYILKTSMVGELAVCGKVH